MPATTKAEPAPQARPAIAYAMPPTFRGVMFRSWWRLAQRLAAVTGYSASGIGRLLRHYDKDAERVLQHCQRGQVIVGGQTYRSRKAFLAETARLAGVSARTLEYWHYTQGIPLERIAKRARQRQARQ